MGTPKVVNRNKRFLLFNKGTKLFLLVKRGTKLCSYSTIIGTSGPPFCSFVHATFLFSFQRNSCSFVEAFLFEKGTPSSFLCQLRVPV